jgi:tetratricopeptide (TPR) repeat protein
MTTVSELKQKARDAERRGQWKDALESYEQLTRAATGSEELDVGVWNRIGDLHLRLAQPGEAVAAYTRGIDAYLDAGHPNNAIALCNKILRSEPDNGPMQLRLAVLNAQSGFAADARLGVTRFVERAAARGEGASALDGVMAAVERLAPESLDIRLIAAEALQSGGREADALRLLREAYSTAVQSGRSARAAEILARLQALEPPAPEPVVAAGTSAPVSLAAALQPVSILTPDPEADSAPDSAEVGELPQWLRW